MSIISQMKFPFYLSLTLLTGWSAQAQADTVITVGVASHGGAVILGGSVIPLKEVTLAAQMPGRIVSIAGEEGDEFKAGTILVKINDDDLKAKKTAAEAQLSSAQNGMQNAQVQYNRELWNPQIYNPRPMAGMGMPSMFDGLFDNGIMPGNGGNKSIERHADLVSQGTQVSAARSRITEAESALRAIEARLRDTEAVAPFDGVIMEKMVEIGDTVQPGQSLVIFSYTKFLRILAEVPARLVPGLKKGMVVPARLDVGNTLINARVAQISPVANSTQHTVTVKFDLPEGVPGGPGMYAEVMIPDVSSPSRALPVVPLAAIERKGSLPSLMVLDENSKPQMRLVRIGEVIDDDSVTILSGLKPGERVLVRGRNQ
ncbi:MAG: efflux RND transporter periplasmic adaptor subunit [Gammaproteobacteria bacterium]|nr:efflux RND transporter periplasmic adaptor subunit [Gammaproteobacteria bacterium]